MVACGMGLDARIMAAAEHEWKRRLGFGAYVGAASASSTRLEPSHFRIVADGDAIEIEGYLALVANAGELVPGRIGPRQPIDPADGRLELIVLGGTTRWRRLPRRRRSCMLRTGRARRRRDPAVGQPGHASRPIPHSRSRPTATTTRAGRLEVEVRAGCVDRPRAAG